MFLRLPTETKQLIIAKARSAGRSPTAYIVEAATGTPHIRSRRSPTVNAELLARTLAELNKLGSNMNQIARTANSIAHIDSILLRAAIAELTDLRRQVLAALTMDARRDAQ